MIKEDFLHYCWRFRKWTSTHLKTTLQESVEVVQTGVLNHNSGPDFLNAQLKIGNTLWSGNVEIHLNASDWFAHHHQKDKSYDNVILHVVMYADVKVYRTDGTEIPTIEVKSLIPEAIKDKYLSLLSAKDPFPCCASLHRVSGIFVDSFLERVAVERLEAKSQAFLELLHTMDTQWEETLYVWFARAFGFKINALPFEMLARTLPQKMFAKYKHQPLQIEALLFGNAGFLDSVNSTDVYLNELIYTYNFLKKKHHLHSIEVSNWKFLRLRPSNFPTRRIAQFAAFVIKSQYLFSNILEIDNVKTYKEIFENLPIHPYWEKHYHFGSETKSSSVQLGKTSIDTLVLNAVAVFLFVYGRYFSIHKYVEKALNLLETIKAEQNHIIKMYENAGLEIKNGLQSQAILQLNQQYCLNKKCVSCGIGIKLISS